MKHVFRLKATDTLLKFLMAGQITIRDVEPTDDLLNPQRAALRAHQDADLSA
jgi:hypothetical protein